MCCRSRKYFSPNRGFLWFEIIPLEMLVLVHMFLKKLGLLRPPSPPWNFQLVTLLGVSMNILQKKKEKMSFTFKCGGLLGPEGTLISKACRCSPSYFG